MKFSADSLRSVAADMWRRDAELRVALGNSESAWMSKVMKLEFAPKGRDTESSIVAKLRDEFLIAPRQEAAAAAVKQEANAKILRGIVATQDAASQAQLGAPVTGANTNKVERLDVKQQAEATWRANPAIRAEFASMGDYIALMKAEESGKVRVVAGSCKSYTAADFANP